MEKDTVTLEQPLKPNWGGGKSHAKVGPSGLTWCVRRRFSL